MLSIALAIVLTRCPVPHNPESGGVEVGEGGRLAFAHMIMLERWN